MLLAAVQLVATLARRRALPPIVPRVLERLGRRIEEIAKAMGITTKELARRD
jgi:hypothetical protein